MGKEAERRLADLGGGVRQEREQRLEEVVEGEFGDDGVLEGGLGRWRRVLRGEQRKEHAGQRGAPCLGRGPGVGQEERGGRREAEHRRRDGEQRDGHCRGGRVLLQQADALEEDRAGVLVGECGDDDEEVADRVEGRRRDLVDAVELEEVQEQPGDVQRHGREHRAGGDGKRRRREERERLQEKEHRVKLVGNAKRRDPHHSDEVGL